MRMKHNSAYIIYLEEISAILKWELETRQIHKGVLNAYD